MGHVGHFKPTHMFHPSSGTSLDAYFASPPSPTVAEQLADVPRPKIDLLDLYETKPSRRSKRHIVAIGALALLARR